MSCVWGSPDWDQADCCDKNGPYYVGDADALLYCDQNPFANQSPGAGSPFGGTPQPDPFAPPSCLSSPTDPSCTGPGPSLSGPATAPSIAPGLLALHSLSPSFSRAVTSPSGTVGGIPSRALGLGGGSPAPAPSPAGPVGQFAGTLGTTTMVVLGAGAALVLWLVLKK